MFRSGASSFRVATIEWMTRTIDLLDTLATNDSFLIGTQGGALAVLAAATGSEPALDRLSSGSIIPGKFD